MNNTPSNGFSLIEVMVATLLFSIMLLGFINYQQVIVKQYHFLSNRLKADKIAFALLDSYPQNADKIIPKGWRYAIQTQPLNTQCKMVLVIITIPNEKEIQQQRLFCNESILY